MKKIILVLLMTFSTFASADEAHDAYLKRVAERFAWGLYGGTDVQVKIPGAKESKVLHSPRRDHVGGTAVVEVSFDTSGGNTCYLIVVFKDGSHMIFGPECRTK